MKPVVVFRHVPHEGLGTIAGALERNHIPYTIVDILSRPAQRFDPRQLAGLIVMGGPMNVDETDKYPPLSDEVRWLQEAVDARLPVLGVCLGAQLLAKSLGARVYPNRMKEIGWYEIELLSAADSDPMFDLMRSDDADARARNVTVFQWHGDTFDLPAGAIQLARSPQCENQAFRYGGSAYGLQFHMEVTAEIIDTWLRESTNCGELATLDYIDPAAICRDTPNELPTMQAMGQRAFDWFAFMCSQSSS